MKDLLVVGAGLTGAAICNNLRIRLGDKIRITLWEASNTVGGRLNTLTSNVVPNVIADTGAQFITTNRTQRRLLASFYDRMFAERLLTPLTAPIENFKGRPDADYYVAPYGFKSCVESLIRAAGLTPEFHHRLSSIEHRGSSWLVTASDGNEVKKSQSQQQPQPQIQSQSQSQSQPHNQGQGIISKQFDAVVTTIPIPELLRIRGISEISRKDTALHSALEQVEYKPRFSVVLFYDSTAAQRIERILRATDDDAKLQRWAAKFVYDNDAIRYLAFDSHRRGLDRSTIEQHGCALVVHTSVPFGVRHVDADLNDTTSVLLEYVKGLLQAEQLAFPEPAEVRIVPYAYSQTHQSFSEPVGAGFVELGRSPPLIVAGDGFAEASAVDGCLLSASRATDRIVELFAAADVQFKKEQVASSTK